MEETENRSPWALIDYDKEQTMTALQPRYSSEEFARRGTEIYEQQIRPPVEKNNTGKIVAVDIETGAFEIADDTLTASDHFPARHPESQA